MDHEHHGHEHDHGAPSDHGTVTPKKPGHAGHPKTYGELIELGPDPNWPSALAEACLRQKGKGSLETHGHGEHTHGDTSHEPPKPTGDAAQVAHAHHAPSSADAPAQPTRLNAATLNSTDQRRFKDAVSAMVKSGAYRRLVKIHQHMEHDMHGMRHDLALEEHHRTMKFEPTGLSRFLPWHRRFLAEFEKELNVAHRELEPDAEDPIGLPYWDWVSDFPDWLDGFLPYPEDLDPMPPRKLKSSLGMPTEQDLKYLVTRSDEQLKQYKDLSPYARFTWALEGWGAGPDGKTSLPAHNHGHNFVGGLMGQIGISPADPGFWLHHCQVDRLWHFWQQRHPGEKPPLTGKHRILDPWTEDCDDMLDVAQHGYAYDEPWEQWLLDWLRGDEPAPGKKIKIEA